ELRGRACRPQRRSVVASAGADLLPRGPPGARARHGRRAGTLPGALALPGYVPDHTGRAGAPVAGLRYEADAGDRRLTARYSLAPLRWRWSWPRRRRRSWPRRYSSTST